MWWSSNINTARETCKREKRLQVGVIKCGLLWLVEENKCSWVLGLIWETLTSQFWKGLRVVYINNAAKQNFNRHMHLYISRTSQTFELLNSIWTWFKYTSYKTYAIICKLFLLLALVENDTVYKLFNRIFDLKVRLENKRLF